ncbi:hypothetical protein [uncultured Agrobacterium sp.]|uniref:hypothetical protein n=1 Tax=uncultured Agrobacterium sp. TaxID=157277 RepID=UPI0025FA1662|nr:hypothetical protein [uncultured Agrobacterium sp.]
MSGEMTGLGLALGMGVVQTSGVAPPVDPDRYMVFATRARMPSGAIYTALANNTYICTKIKVGCSQFKTRAFRFHFSGFASTEGGNSPQETIVTGTLGTPGNSVIIDEFALRYRGQFYPVTFNGGSAGVTIADQTNGVWTDEITIPGDVDAEGDVELWTVYHVASAGDKVWPVYRVQHHRGERVWGGASLGAVQAFQATPDAASTSALISSTGDAGYGQQAQYQHYGPDFMVARGDWDGRPVALVVADSIGEARQEYGPNADTRGNLGYLRKWLDRKDTAGRVPHLVIGMPGSASLRELTGSGSSIATRRWEILDQVKAFNNGKLPFTAILNQMGQNDTTTSYATWWSRVTGLASRLRTRYPGVRLVHLVPLGRAANSQEYTDANAVSYSANNVWPADGTDASGKWRLRNDLLALKDNVADAAIDTLAAWQGSAGLAKPPMYDELPWSSLTEQAGTDGTATYQSFQVADGSLYQPEQQLRVYSPDGTTLLGSGNVIAEISGDTLKLQSAIATVFPIGARLYQIPVNYGDGLHPMPVLVRQLATKLADSEKAKLSA